MRKKSVMFIVLFLTFIIQTTVFADAPYKTFTLGPNNKIVETQTAFEPDEVILKDFMNPEDIFFDDNTGDLYIADTGNSRVIVINKEGNIREIGSGIVFSPSGIFVDDNGNIYVADYGNYEVYIFNKEGSLIKRIGKPTEPIFGSSNEFVPKKLAVDKRGNIYVACEGLTNGIATFSKDGVFMGYTASNQTNTTLKMVLQRLIFTAKQKEQLLKIKPPSPTSIAIDRDGLIYTVTNGLKYKEVKKFNIAGINILPGNMAGDSNLVDIDVDNNGNIYALSQYGYIFEYDSFGNLLFIFGGEDELSERRGLFRNAAAIDVTQDGKIYVIDKEKSILVSFKPTEFAKRVMKGDELYKEGLYLESKPIWEEVLDMNSSFILSYKALAKAYFKMGDYKKALECFKIAEDKLGYSDAFWQIRNEWLQKNTPIIILILIMFIVIKKAVIRIDKRRHILEKPRRVIQNIKNKKLIKEILFSFRFLRHPIDSYYDLKRYGRASVLSATILYLWFFVMEVIKLYVTSPIFSTFNAYKINILNVAVTLFVPTILWIISNYLVSEINDGEGTLKQIYIGTIYALSPYLIFALPVAIISNVLTFNEAFLYDFPLFIIKVWSILLMVIMVMEIHNYDLKETMRNISITIFGMILIVLLVSIITILFNQEVDFVKSIIWELRFRVLQ
ncbi:YIP1 family protein [Caloramator sp. CAR-1]|uniref:YIP1 family protein n=2 Tax=unclassified Caloramator TaxID=2629145 RepID=UPI0026E381A1|nr:YIP1 family protein [Caloramator sp. CAR-1]MDO6356030.1 YIP1 family protein [Caloramator sp. CAR-1]